MSQKQRALIDHVTMIIILMISLMSIYGCTQSSSPTPTPTPIPPTPVPSDTATPEPSPTSTSTITPSPTPIPTDTSTPTPIPEGFVIIPNVIDLQLEEAQQLLEEVGLEFEVFEIYDKAIPEYMVLTQSPAPGEVVEEFSFIMLEYAISELKIMDLVVYFEFVREGPYRQEQSYTVELPGNTSCRTILYTYLALETNVNEIYHGLGQNQMTGSVNVYDPGGNELLTKIEYNPGSFDTTVDGYYRFVIRAVLNETTFAYGNLSKYFLTGEIPIFCTP